MVQVYTLRTHSVVQTLRFSSRVLSVRASCRLLIVALDAQVGSCNPDVDAFAWHFGHEHGLCWRISINGKAYQAMPLPPWLDLSLAEH